MKPGLVWAFAVAVLALAGCGSTTVVTKTVTVSTAAKSDFGPPSELTQFGYIKKLSRKGDGYVVRFDPALLLTGVTANTAAAEDGAVPPGQPVPNDNYRLNEGHRLLTYLVPAARARHRAHEHGQGALGETPITVDELFRIVNGGKHRRLFEPLATGVWLRLHSDTVRSLDQQYQPVRPLAGEVLSYDAPSTEEIARRTGLDPADILRFDGNTSPQLLPSTRAEALLEELSRIHTYPHGGYPVSWKRSLGTRASSPRTSCSAPALTT